jgi:hypothetical protein
VKYAGDVEFDSGNFFPGRFLPFMFHPVGRVQHHQAGSINLGAAFGDPCLHRLLMTEVFP